MLSAAVRQRNLYIGALATLNTLWVPHSTTWSNLAGLAAGGLTGLIYLALPFHRFDRRRAFLRLFATALLGFCLVASTSWLDGPMQRRSSGPILDPGALAAAPHDSPWFATLLFLTSARPGAPHHLITTLRSYVDGFENHNHAMLPLRVSE